MNWLNATRVVFLMPSISCLALSRQGVNLVLFFPIYSQLAMCLVPSTTNIIDVKSPSVLTSQGFLQMNLNIQFGFGTYTLKLYSPILIFSFIGKTREIVLSFLRFMFIQVCGSLSECNVTKGFTKPSHAAITTIQLKHD